MTEEDRLPADRCYAATGAAYRAAGQAVAGHVLGYPCGRIIVEDGDRARVDFPQKLIAQLDRTLNGTRRLKAWPRYFVDNAIISCAGPAAEFRFRRETGVDERKLYSARSNRNQVEAMNKSPVTFDLSYRALQDHAWRAAEAMIAREDIWAGVTTLAERLIDCAALPGREVRRILHGTGL